MSDTHDHLLTRLASAAERKDPVPPHVLAAARAAFAWRTVAEDIAELVYDSVTDEELVGVRGGPRQLSFAGRDVTVEIEAVPGGRRVIGQVAPGAGGEVEVRHRTGSVRAPIDELGRFAADGVTGGPVSLRCRVDLPDGELVTETEWILL